MSDPCAKFSGEPKQANRKRSFRYVHNLLDDPLFDVSASGGLTRLTLPELIIALRDERVTALRGVGAIQRQFVWRLLVRCAVRAAGTEPLAALTVASLRDRLAATTPDLECWSLHRDDGGAAFLQVPLGAPTPAAAGYKHEDLSRLTIIPGGKNHEFKRGVAARLSPSDALNALLEYQFGSVFTKGNYASQIMGSSTGKGSGSPLMAPWWPSLGASFVSHVHSSLAHATFARDVLGLRGDVWALWTLPWAGAADGMPASRLAPNFLPLARRVRLAAPSADGMFDRLWFASSTGPRIADHTAGSGLGDAFTPFVARETQTKVRGVMGAGFDYREVARLLLDAAIDPRGQSSFAVKYAARTSKAESLPVLMEGVAFDQGKTMGFHQRVIELPRLSVLDPAPHALLLDAMLTDAKSAESALAAAGRTWMSGSARPKKGDRGRVDRCRSFLTERIDRLFFAEVTALIDKVRRSGLTDGAQARWRTALAAAARTSLQEVMSATPVPSARRFERAALAVDALTRGFLKSGWMMNASQTPVDPMSAPTEHAHV